VGVKGRLKDMGLVDIAQIFNAERKTVAIHLGSEMGYGRVYIKDGRIVHATYREHTGTEALYQILAWQDGEFEVEPDVVSPDVTINESTEALVLEAMRRLDESRGAPLEEHERVGDIESIRLINSLLEHGILEKI